MFHKGLNKEVVVDAAKELIEQDGFSTFSMRKLAEKLNVKTASLYAHIDSMDALLTEIGLAAKGLPAECCRRETRRFCRDGTCGKLPTLRDGTRRAVPIHFADALRR